MKNKDLEGKTVVITGASGGLGEYIAYKCAENKARLFLLARNEDRLNRVANRIREEHGIDCTVMALDVSDLRKIPSIFERIYEEVEAIDVLINNAGYGIFAEAEDLKLTDLERMFSINVLGLISCTKAVIPSMRKRQFGHIINIASQAGKLATPKSSAYAATKHAVLGFTNSLRMEMARFGVYVTAVNPGPIRTEFFRYTDPEGAYLENLGRVVLEPEKVAEKIVQVIFTKKREINLPWWMNWTSILHTLMPNTVERLGRKAFFKK